MNKRGNTSNNERVAHSRRPFCYERRCWRDGGEGCFRCRYDRFNIVDNKSDYDECITATCVYFVGQYTCGDLSFFSLAPRQNYARARLSSRASSSRGRISFRFSNVSRTVLIIKSHYLFFVDRSHSD